jgi:hypothetical protein
MFEGYWFDSMKNNYYFNEDNINLVIEICQDKNIALLNTHNDDKNIRKICERVLKKDRKE